MVVMKNIFIFCLLFCTCAAPKKRLKEDRKCLQIVEKKKVSAPSDIESIGVYSNVKLEDDGETMSGYTIRVVRRKAICQALIIEFEKSIEPAFYAVSNLFECRAKPNTYNLVTKLGFRSPFSESSPEDFYFGFDGKLNQKRDLEGHITFPTNDLRDRPAKTKVVLSLGQNDGLSMAQFDWEVIQKLKLKKSCYH